MKNNAVKLHAALLLAGMLDSAAAQEPSRESAQDAVVVTATRTERSIAGVPASVTVVTQEQIRNTPGESVDDVLRTVAGLEMPIASSYQLHPTSNFPSMLGTKNGLTSHVLVMVDGVPINDAYEGFVQWNRVPKENIERIEVVRGGGASLWGTYALGGVINIITRTPKREKYSADIGYGSLGTFHEDIYGTPLFSDALKVSLAYNRFKTDGFDQVVPGSATPGFYPRPASTYTKTSFDSDNLQGVVNFKADPALYGLARINYHENTQPEFVLKPMSTGHKITSLDMQVTKLVDDTTRLTATAFGNHGVFFTNNSSFNDNFAAPTGCGGTCLAPSDQGESFLSNNHRATADDVGLSLIWAKSALSQYIPSLSAGVDFRQIAAREHVDSFVPQAFGVPVYLPDPANTGDFQGKQRFLGVFSQMSVFPVRGLEIAPSVRFQQWHNYDGFLLQAINPADKGPQGPKTVDDFSWRVSARGEITPDVAARAAVYKSFNAPTLDNLYRTFSANGFTVFSNPNLNPETLHGGEVGLDFHTEHSKSELTLFQNTTHDYIAFASDASGNFVNQNLGESKAYGVMANASVNLGPTLVVRAGYTYTRARIVSSDLHQDWLDEQLAFIPKNKADASITYREDKLNAALLVRYASRSYGVNGLQFNAIGTTPLTQSSFAQDPHTIVDAKLGYALSRKSEAYVSLVNLFDRKYVANNDGFAPPLYGTPRTVFFGVKLQTE
ncbi:MAG TPA: TonB-dependent receptor [Burkholderiales bacterium]|nr:TonB-dependent receptor [Burkholderiales bacterium]